MWCVFTQLMNNNLSKKKRKTQASWALGYYCTSLQTSTRVKKQLNLRSATLSDGFPPWAEYFILWGGEVGGIRCLVLFTQSAFCLGRGEMDRQNPYTRSAASQTVAEVTDWKGRRRLFQREPRLVAPMDAEPEFIEDSLSWKLKMLTWDTVQVQLGLRCCLSPNSISPISAQQQ